MFRMGKAQDRVRAPRPIAPKHPSMHPIFHSTLLALLLSACSAVSPQAGDLTVNGGLSVFPNIGVTMGGSQVITRNANRAYTVDLQGHYQPWDDELLHDDGNPSAGSVSQMELGISRRWSVDSHREWNLSAGFTWFRAGEFPNIVQDQGDYFGIYGGWGLMTTISERMSIGPGIGLIIAGRETTGLDDLHFIPRITYTLRWSL